MTIRPYTPDDYAMVVNWWIGHKAPVLPSFMFLPGHGFIAERDGQSLAVSWLFVAPNTEGGLGMIQYTTANPYAMITATPRAIETVLEHLEGLAKELGCGSVVSFVRQDRGEQRIFAENGWSDLAGVPHNLYGKALKWP